jgi:hypothetical protein
VFQSILRTQQLKQLDLVTLLESLLGNSFPDDSEKVHYGLAFDGKDHHVELWPNYYFISPGMMIEERGVGASLDINNVKIRRANTTRIISLYLESRATPGISASRT